MLTSTAVISNDTFHRYNLVRVWDLNKPRIMFIGLNPSRADATFNDPTITRCIQFASDWNFGGLYFANLFSFRTPDPSILIQNLHCAKDRLTDYHLKVMIGYSDKVVCAWGSWTFTGERARQVKAFIRKPYCFGLNKDLTPKHPLYLKADTKLQLF
jgi:hypothetical protein